MPFATWPPSLNRSAGDCRLLLMDERVLQEVVDLRAHFRIVPDEEMTPRLEAHELRTLNLPGRVETAFVRTVEIIFRADHQRRTSHVLERVPRQTGGDDGLVPDARGASADRQDAA